LEVLVDDACFDVVLEIWRRPKADEIEIPESEMPIRSSFLGERRVESTDGVRICQFEKFHHISPHSTETVQANWLEDLPKHGE
jgi:hypothetical protein